MAAVPTDDPLTYSFVENQFLEVFDRLDADKDGVLQPNEVLQLAKVFCHLGGNEQPSEEDIVNGVPDLLQTFDPCHEGTIKRSAFALAFMGLIGFSSPTEFQSPLTERQFFNRVRGRFPLLFVDNTGSVLTHDFVREQFGTAFDRFDSNHKGWLLAQDLEKMAIEFAKIGGIPAPDAEAVEAAVRDTKKTFGLHIDDVMTREAFADRYMQISGFMNCEEFSTPVTEEMFMAYMTFNCPTLFAV